ncbi:hypothetical protein [Staphylococcus carnosus]|uniref:Uncharacterized protein n=1 Tax=Staphylococcus carnosus (strain TM300) TaxID=396513 RepID=B9DL16_STACT|nr:hypothetical protein [Staphylococcus carnosus]QPT04957.1 hypothetical protein I6G40_05905 [Staphylococcus carnosus]QQS84425.1 hypothetical protein I6J04_08445 [Staphylococcus carnosus]QRQ04365.1 hypothetical protein I6J34_08840 [Staphylococcus carnosus]UQA67682.1 hypothetical protein Sta3580_01935 [Staphylococcus carnosus]CAL28883.1 hypothetical protein SCA_1978 [Staphylococcus carnosus subsp. carnosus TM300]
MVLRLVLILIAFVANTTLTYYLIDFGEVLQNFLKSMSISMILVFIFYYAKLVIETKRE